MGKFKTLKDSDGGVTVVRKDSDYDNDQKSTSKRIKEKYKINISEGAAARYIGTKAKIKAKVLKDSIYPKEK